MVERIKRIIAEKGLHSSTFADSISVSRGTISHILNGRNKPSLDTINCILKTYSDINRSWLLDDEGPMYVHEKAFLQRDLFGEKNSIESIEKPDIHEYPLKKEDKKPENKTNQTAVQEIKLPTNLSKKIDKIMIFFSDKTFMTFLPEE